uniref:Flippase GtrA (Transmembrane translocase of bactoprenol-linked glucose) n=1 Tax=Candidatus Kentrum sp. FW TaxID=2126338 RepID=A0A450TK19_9GAMM|nr:MAG: Putative flippase GtrA (transmembrane translocase of bactoprenol-linked glucose) [Candidatus Kentron sp. FW]
MIRYFFTKQFLEFVAVGGLAASLNWVSRIILGNWMPFSAAVIFAYAIGMIVAFMLNSLFVFPTSRKPKNRQARDFIIVNLVFLPVVWVVSTILEPVFRSFWMVSYSQAMAHGIAIAVPPFLTFLFYKFFAFEDIGYGRE